MSSFYSSASASKSTIPWPTEADDQGNVWAWRWQPDGTSVHAAPNGSWSSGGNWQQSGNSWSSASQPGDSYSTQPGGSSWQQSWSSASPDGFGWNGTSSAASAAKGGSQSWYSAKSDPGNNWSSWSATGSGVKAAAVGSTSVDSGFGKAHAVLEEPNILRTARCRWLRPTLATAT
eukprot:gnl/TRDRNA2_/TRDRNA2_122024_c4_seq2.p1 gnl/TRDRNA2_/TRDRNA2_122024_c4~~gnl/TRDRNA2_/TRDRNA2_122024_c4_seq2.p1  ORF type:complete len:175 (-),score=19.15 gnl/TRDRNA2_/TRDRNA2_122024_c4_seq2:167-691(-)